MPTKIRLQRFGKKGQPFYRIVVADSRAPRDGRFIENIGTYNPLTVPATININAERALYWLQVGAQPTDTARAVLAYKGILYKNHLRKGVEKGAMTQEQADAKFNAWMEEKEQRISQKIKDKDLAQKEVMKKKIQDEAKISEERAKAIAEKRAKMAAAKIKAEEGEEEVVADDEAASEVEETTSEEIAAEEPVAEEPATEEPVAEEPATEEPAAEEPATEEPATEEPVAEEPAADEPAAEETDEEETKE